MLETYNPEGWAKPRGYSQVVAGEGRHVFLSGQIGWNPRTEKMEAQTLAEEARQTLANVVEALAAAGARPAASGRQGNGAPRQGSGAPRQGSDGGQGRTNGNQPRNDRADAKRTPPPKPAPVNTAMAEALRKAGLGK